VTEVVSETSFINGKCFI